MSKSDAPGFASATGSASSSENALISALGAATYSRITSLVIIPKTAAAVAVTITAGSSMTLYVPATGLVLTRELKGIIDSGANSTIVFDVGAGADVEVMAWYDSITG